MIYIIQRQTIEYYEIEADSEGQAAEKYHMDWLAPIKEEKVLIVKQK